MNDRTALPEPATAAAASMVPAASAAHPDDAGGAVTIGMALARVDGPAKVGGTARYAAEHPAEGLVFGVVVGSTVASGRITHIDSSAARAVPGVLDVLTHTHRPKMRGIGLAYKDMTAPGGSPFKPLYDDEVFCSGQPVALVLADTFEAARHAAALVRIAYAQRPHRTDLLEHLGDTHAPAGIKLGFSPPPKPLGDADAALAAAPCKVDGEFYSGVEHHNPMEMHASTVLRGDDGHLTIYDKTQGSQNCRWVVSRAFGLPKSRVTVRNPYVGGAFGSGLRPQYQLLLAVMGALHLKRSVRVVLTRQQMFTFGHRPETWQRVALAAERDGTLTALIHEAVAETSRREDYVEVVVNWGAQLYRSPNMRFDYQLVALDHYTPIDMRAPGAAHGVHALEVAMDELSYAIPMDPLALRLANYTERGAEDLPFSTKTLAACYAQAAERFGWARRPAQPRALREGHELVGWGMASGVWDAMQMFARAEVTLASDGRLTVRSAASDIGTGTCTVMTQIAAAAMGLPMDRVRFEMGDSDLPVAPVEGGSAHVTTIGSAVDAACEKLRRALLKQAAAMPGSPFAAVALREVVFSGGALRLAREPMVAMPLVDLALRAPKGRIVESHLLLPNALKQKDYTRLVHSAVFCEVKVDEDFGTVRVTRVVSAIDAGVIINPLTARSQIIGGIVWGISAALHEETHADHALGRFMNHNLSEYHVPVQADIGEIDVIFAGQPDHIVSRLGAKGVGEIGLLGVSAAVCNAIFHATGRRIRSTPMTPDKVMQP